MRSRNKTPKVKGVLPVDPLLRLIRRTQTDEDGCWNWMGTVSRDGYGRIRIGSRTDHSTRLVATHRLIYECFSGQIPSNLEIDHLCQNTRCVNPWHLEVVTHKGNMERGKNAQKHIAYMGMNSPRKTFTLGQVVDDIANPVVSPVQIIATNKSN